MTPEEERVFAELVAAARSGERCPTNGEMRAAAFVVPDLCALGAVRSEIYANNYRVVEILLGDHAGLRTKEFPLGGRSRRHRSSGPASLTAIHASGPSDADDDLDIPEFLKVENRPT